MVDSFFLQIQTGTDSHYVRSPLPCIVIVYVVACVAYVTDRLDGRARACGMEVSTEKSKVVVNSDTNISAEITVNGERLEEVDSFKKSWIHSNQRGKIGSRSKDQARLSRVSNGRKPHQDLEKHQLHHQDETLQGWS